MSDMKKRPVHKTERIRGLDGLRTLALFGVLLFHMFPQKVSGGYFGVIIFFVISGFLTAYSTVKKGRVSILSYYAKRMERIYPALILMLFISIEIISLVDKFKLLNVQEEVVSILLGYNNYWQISKSADYFANLSNNSAFTHLWYISILLQFELVWPWLYRILSLFRKPLAAFGVIVLLFLFVMPIASMDSTFTQTMLYYDTLCRVHALLIGAWIGWLKAGPEGKRSLRAFLVVPVVLAFFIGSVPVFLKAAGTLPGVYHYGIVLYGLLCGMVVLLISCSRARFLRLLDNPVTSFFSRYSYEIYLWQYPVLFVFGLLKMNTAFWHYLLQVVVLLILSVWTNIFVANAGTFLKARIKW